MTRRPPVLILLCSGLVLLSAAVPPRADQPPPSAFYDQDLYFYECKRHDSEPDRVTMVEWRPELYWEVELSDDPDVPREVIHDLQWVLRPYMVFLVHDGKVNEDGRLQFRSEGAIRATMRLEDSEGNKYEAVAPDAIGHDVRGLLDDVIGAERRGSIAGDGLHYFVFRARKPGGAKIAVVDQPGHFTLHLGTTSFRFRTPLGALVPKKSCPTCGEALNGAWSHCPWDGAALEG